MFSFMAINQKAIFIRIFRVLHTVQFSRFFTVDVHSTKFDFVSLRFVNDLALSSHFAFTKLLSVSRDSQITISQLFSLVNNFFKVFSNLTCCLKGRSLFGSFVPVGQGHGISYHPHPQKSTAFRQSFSNCFNCTYNSQKNTSAIGKMTIYTKKGRILSPPEV